MNIIVTDLIKIFKWLFSKPEQSEIVEGVDAKQFKDIEDGIELTILRDPIQPSKPSIKYNSKPCIRVLAPKIVTWLDIIKAKQNITLVVSVLDMKLSKYFTLREMLTYNNGSMVFDLEVLTPTILANLKLLCKRLDTYREKVGYPFNVTSGFRSKSWNIKVGGVSNSTHTQGKAVDIYVKQVTPKKIKTICSTWLGGLGTYPRNKKRLGFNHFDISNNRRWRG